MNSTALSFFGALLAPSLLAASLTSPAAAQERPLPAERAQMSATDLPARPAAPANVGGIDFSHVWYDQPGDGRLWARGERWKMSFGAEGATYFPAFGPRQPHNLPHALSPESVTIGGQPIAFQRDAAATRAGDRVELDRGAFVEAYELAPDEIEQLFVFPTLPARGELVVRIPLGSELEKTETPAGLELSNEHGRVSYSRAVAIDAAGRRVAAPTRFEGGEIVIRVGADFLADAALPLTIDPVVGGIVWLDSTTSNTYAPDIAWDPFHGVWLAVYDVTFSATDTDVFARMLGSTGALLASAWVDFTSDSWIRPRVANNGAAHLFLAVAEKTNVSPHAVVGRTVQPNGTILTLSSQFDIGGSAVGDKITPDVGGDPWLSGLSYFCVTFTHVLHTSASEIGYRLVTPSGVVVGTGPTYLPSVDGSPDITPSISRSNDGSRWLIAFVRNTTAFTFSDVYGARVNWDGTLVDGPFGVTAGMSGFEFTPCASSPLAGTQRFAVAFTRRAMINGDTDIWVAALDGGMLLQRTNLTALENSGQQSVAQLEPSIDSDGRHFVVSYSEFDPAFTNWDVFLSDVYLSDSTIGVSQPHVQLFHLGLWERVSRIAAQRGLSTLGPRYGILYEIRENDTDHDVAFGLFDAVLGGSYSTFCAGDGSGTACPCGNNGAAGRGCANSVDPSGGSLTAVGVASTLSDTLQLQATGMPDSTCLFFQGTSSSAASAFGDGLRCVSGTVIRLGARAISLGSSSYPAPGDPAISVAGSVPLDGGTRTYQVWYRNAAAFCTSATFNLTNGVTVNWAR